MGVRGEKAWATEEEQRPVNRVGGETDTSALGPV